MTSKHKRITAAQAHNLPALKTEFGAVFIGMPLLVAILIYSQALSPAMLPVSLLAVLAIAVALLGRTPGFEWRRLWHGKLIVDRPLLWSFMLLVTILASVMTLWLAPDFWLVLPTEYPGTWLLVSIGYPLLSVIPQGIIYRALFFERYRLLFRNQRQAMIVNAACFALAHAFYLNPIAPLLTFFGGLLFAWAYIEKRSFLFAALLHAFAGWILFTTGIGGAYFNSATITP